MEENQKLPKKFDSEGSVDGDGKQHSENHPYIEDACESCYKLAKRKRRYSTMVPSVRKCSFDCGYYVFEIHLSCMDCAKKYNYCPWCNRTPYVRHVKKSKTEVEEL